MIGLLLVALVIIVLGVLFILASRESAEWRKLYRRNVALEAYRRDRDRK